MITVFFFWKQFDLKNKFIHFYSKTLMWQCYLRLPQQDYIWTTPRPFRQTQRALFFVWDFETIDFFETIMFFSISSNFFFLLFMNAGWTWSPAFAS